jgi:hypothetical protein
VSPKVVQVQPRIGDHPIEFGHHGGLRQRGQLRERPFRGIWTQRLSVVGRMRDRMRDQSTDMFPLERKKVVSGPAITCD